MPGKIGQAIRDDIRDLGELFGVDRTRAQLAIRLADEVDSDQSGGKYIPQLAKELRGVLSDLMGAGTDPNEDDDLNDLGTPD